MVSSTVPSVAYLRSQVTTAISREGLTEGRHPERERYGKTSVYPSRLKESVSRCGSQTVVLTDEDAS
jgi:hypothetical protein